MNFRTQNRSDGNEKIFVFNKQYLCSYVSLDMETGDIHLEKWHLYSDFYLFLLFTGLGFLAKFPNSSEGFRRDTGSDRDF